VIGADGQNQAADDAAAADKEEGRNRMTGSCIRQRRRLDGLAGNKGKTGKGG
jgi:hypothetical protein